MINPSQRPLPDNTQHSTTDRNPCPLWDSNPQSQQASGRKLTFLDRAATGTGTSNIMRLKLRTIRAPFSNMYQTTFFLLYLSLYVVGTNDLLQLEADLHAKFTFSCRRCISVSLTRAVDNSPLSCLSSYHTVSKNGTVFFLRCK